MYDLSAEFNKFYRNKVVLPATVQNELREKKKLNIKRLKDGLLEYNQENGTSYKICEDRVQGSMASSRFAAKDLPEPGTPRNKPLGFLSFFRFAMMTLWESALSP